MVCVDENNTIWKGDGFSLDGFGNKHCNYAFIILTSNYKQGDTIIHALSDYQKEKPLRNEKIHIILPCFCCNLLFD